MDCNLLEHAQICTCQKYRLIWIAPSECSAAPVLGPQERFFLTDDVFNIIGSYLEIHDYYRLYLTGDRILWHKIERSCRQLICKARERVHTRLPLVTTSFDPISLLHQFKTLHSLVLPRVSYPYQLVDSQPSPFTLLPPSISRLEFGLCSPIRSGSLFCNLNWGTHFPDLHTLRLAFQPSDRNGSPKDDQWVKMLPQSVTTLSLMNCLFDSTSTLHYLSHRIPSSAIHLDPMSVSSSLPLPLLRRLELSCELSSLDLLVYPPTLSALILQSHLSGHQLPVLEWLHDIDNIGADSSSEELSSSKLRALQVYIAFGVHRDGFISAEDVKRLPQSLRVFGLGSDRPASIAPDALLLLPKGITYMDLSCVPLTSAALSSLPCKNLRSIRLQQSVYEDDETPNLPSVRSMSVLSDAGYLTWREPPPQLESLVVPLITHIGQLKLQASHLVELTVSIRFRVSDMFRFFTALRKLCLTVVEVPVDLALLPRRLEFLSIVHESKKLLPYPFDSGRRLPPSITECHLEFIELPSMSSPQPIPDSKPRNAISSLKGLLLSVFTDGVRTIPTDEEEIRQAMKFFSPRCLCSARFIRDGRIVPNKLVAAVAAVSVKGNIINTP